MLRLPNALPCNLTKELLKNDHKMVVDQSAHVTQSEYTVVVHGLEGI